MCVYTRVHARRPKEGVRSPRIGVTGSCEPPDMVAGPKLGSSGTSASALFLKKYFTSKIFFNSVYV